MSSLRGMHLLFLLVFLCSSAFAEEAGKVIKVSGTGVVSAKPDRARLHMQVTQVDRSVVAAKKTVDGRVRLVQKMLLDEGVKPAGITTSSLSVYEERNEPLSGAGNRDVTKTTLFRVSRDITVKLEDISRLDTILDKAIDLGTNSVQNIEYYSSKIDELKLEAMRKASEDASKKAAFLARQFGCSVGKARQIEYDYRGREPQPVMYAAARAGAPSFLQGTMDVTATVDVVYQIE